MASSPIQVWASDDGPASGGSPARPGRMAARAGSVAGGGGGLEQRVYKGRAMHPVPVPFPSRGGADTEGASADLSRHLLEGADAAEAGAALVRLHAPAGGGGAGREAAPLGHGGMSGGSAASAVFNLTTTSVGAGIMALPATMKVLGLPFGILAILLLGALTDFALKVLVRTSIAGSHRSYGLLMGASFGPWGRFLTQVFILLQALGSLVVYLIITGDVLSGSTSGGVHHHGILEEWAGGSTWWNGRLPVLLLVLLLCLLPLVSLSRIDSLMTSSAVSVGLAVVFVLFTMGTCAVQFAQGRLAAPRLFPDLSSLPALLRLLTTVPVMANAFICHYNVQPIYEELKDKSEKNMSRVAYFSQLVVTTIYCGAATSSYLLFGDSTASDVLANFDADLGVSKVACDLVRLGYVAHLLLVFPIVHFPLRLTLDILLFPGASKPLSHDTPRFALLTGGLLALTFFCAIVVPDIYVLFGFLGAMVSVSIGFTFPALIALKSEDFPLSPLESSLAWFMLFLGIYLTISGLIADISLL